ELREREPAGLREAAARSAEPVPLRREADEAEAAALAVAEADRARLDGELVEERLGDRLARFARPVAAAEDVEDGLDGRQVDDRVVPLRLHFGELLPEALAPPSRPRALASLAFLGHRRPHPLSPESAASPPPSRICERMPSHTSTV